MKRLKILIADDERELADMLALRLRAAGMQTRVAADGGAAAAARAEKGAAVGA